MNCVVLAGEGAAAVICLLACWGIGDADLECEGDLLGALGLPCSGACIMPCWGLALTCALFTGLTDILEAVIACMVC